MSTSLEDFDMDVKSLVDEIKRQGEFKPAAVQIVMAHLSAKREDLFGADKTALVSHKYALAVVTASIEAADQKQDYFSRVQLGLLADIASGVDALRGEVKDGKDEMLSAVDTAIAKILNELRNQNIVSNDDLSSPDFFNKLAEHFKIDLGELLGLLNDTLEYDVNPQNFEEMLKISIAGLHAAREETHKLRSLTNQIDGLDKILDEADAALNNAEIVDLAKAQSKLHSAREKFSQMNGENESRLIVAEAKIAVARRNIQDAVSLYDQAVAKVTHDLGLAQHYMWDKGNLLSDFGTISPEIDMLIESAEVWEEILKLSPKRDNSEYWAKLKGWQGNIWSKIGERRAGTEDLTKAAEAYRDALKEFDRDTSPLNRATIQNNLGNALQALGKRSSNDALLQEAVVAYRLALEERTRARAPLNWATTQNNLGNALQALGKRSSDDALLQYAVAAYRFALEERTREWVPIDWATTQNNLGAALQALGERSSDDAFLQDAVVAYRLALEERTRERVPLNWATTQNNLGVAFQALGERSSDDALLRDAVAAYRLALEEFCEDNAPYYYRGTMKNLERVQKSLEDIRAQKSK